MFYIYIYILKEATMLYTFQTNDSIMNFNNLNFRILNEILFITLAEGIAILPWHLQRHIARDFLAMARFFLVIWPHLSGRGHIFSVHMAYQS